MRSFLRILLCSAGKAAKRLSLRIRSSSWAQKGLVTLRAEATPDDSTRVAFLYGPVLLAGLIGTANMPREGP